MSRQNSAASATVSSGHSQGLICQAQVALDLTPHSNLVIEHLHQYLSPTHTECEFLYVLPHPPTSDRKFSTFDEEAEQETMRVANTQFDQYAGILSQHHLVVSNRHFIDDADDIESGILSYVEKHPPHILILGMHEPQPKHQGWRISSTSYAIATHAPCSVLVIKRPPTVDRPLKVLFATDGSTYAEQAARQLVRFLPRETSEITVFTAVSINYYVLPVVEPYVDYSPLEHAMKGEAIQMLENTATIFRENGFTVANTYFNLGDPVDQILQEIQANGYDMVALGSHGAGDRLTRWLMGSVSSKVLEYTDASVAILRQQG